MTKNDRKGLRDFILNCKSSIGQISMQPFLYILAFTTFGIGDALTGAFLMGIKGVGAESNAFLSNVYLTQGPGMFIAIKLWATLVILLLVLISYMQSHGKDYWATNGFLAALSIGGIMAVQANMQAIYNYPFMNPSEIILIFLTLMFVFVMTGNFVDSHVAKKSKQDIITYHRNPSEMNYPNLKVNAHPGMAPAYSWNDKQK
ncbi:MAG: hypothetical protein MIO93_02720 [ANME-2 cluster archaeon]|nr:hypothetical protein [ANME-2 cluster archaeon]